jgi:hypothetical protein
MLTNPNLKSFLIGKAIVVLTLMIVTPLLSEYITPYLTWAGDILSAYLVSFVSMFAILIVIEWVIKKTMGVN